MRLTAATADRLPPDVARPGYDWAGQKRGIVHLGIGAFHRAHQAVYTDAAMAAGDRDWAITGVSLRSPDMQAMLMPQDGLYTVAERSAGHEATRLIGAVREVLVAPSAPDAVAAALASPDTRVVTLTVTEKGYHRRSDGTLDVPAVRPGAGTIYHLLARAFADRRAAGLPGLTILSCDNLADNGRVLGAALGTWLEETAPALRGWFEAECACPSTMVDRIVPAMTDERLDEIAARLGMRDEGAVVTEPFRQWVIEDRFAGPRPRWEVAGAALVAEVAPFEAAKLRMLNGAHSALAYLGLAAGHDFVHQAVADPAIRPVVERLMREEAAPTVAAAPGQDLPAYADALLARFANPALPHRLAQIATDGSQKIGQRWLAPLAINRARGRPCPATMSALAAWVRFVRQPAADPMSEALVPRWRDAGEDGIVAALFGPGGLIPAPDALGPDQRAALTRMVRSA